MSFKFCSFFICISKHYKTMVLIFDRNSEISEHIRSNLVSSAEKITGREILIFEFIKTVGVNREKCCRSGTEGLGHSCSKKQLFYG